MEPVFWEWWQHLPSRIDPVLFSLGGFQLRYYGLMYIVAFAITYGLLIHRTRRDGFDYPPEMVQDLMVWLIVGTIIGGRLGYVLFYDPAYFMRHPWKIFLPVDFSQGFRFVGISGMSYHGGMLGVILAAILFGRRRRIVFWEIADFVAPAVPLGYTFGRIGNFINGELLGVPRLSPGACISRWILPANCATPPSFTKPSERACCASSSCGVCATALCSGVRCWVSTSWATVWCGSASNTSVSRMPI